MRRKEKKKKKKDAWRVGDEAVPLSFGERRKNGEKKSNPTAAWRKNKKKREEEQPNRWRKGAAEIFYVLGFSKNHRWRCVCDRSNILEVR